MTEFTGRPRIERGGFRPDRLAATADKPPTDPVDVEFDVDSLTVADLGDIIDSNLLMAINEVETRGGRPPFRFQILSEQEAKAHFEGSGRTQLPLGWTDLKTRTIYWLEGPLKEKMKEGHMGRRSIRGLARHEGGHHAPEIWSITETLMETIGKVDLEPPELEPLFSDETKIAVRTERGVEQMAIGAMRRQKYWQAVFSDCYNGALDHLLESFVTRGASNTQATLDLRALHGQSVEGRDFEPHQDPETGEMVKYDFWERIPRHHQLTQWLVGEQEYYKAGVHMSPADRRRLLEQQAKANLHPDTAKVVIGLMRRNVFDSLHDMTPYDSFFTDEREYARVRKEKSRLVMEQLYPEWVKLFLLEFEEEKAKREEQEKADQKKGDGEKGDGGEDGELSDGQKQQIAGDVMDALLGKTKQMGDGAYGSETEIPDQNAAKQGKFDGVVKQGTGCGKNQASGQEAESAKLDPLAEERARMRQKLGAFDRKQIGELADRFGVDEASIRELRRIEREYGDIIVFLAEQIAEVFLQQRRPITEHAHKEGQLTPGLEHVLVGGLMHGNQDLDIFEQVRQATEFMQTEFEALLDTSGSMQNKRLEMGRIMVIVITMAFMRVRQLLEAEQLLDPSSEDPLRTGIAFFADKPMRLKKQSDPNDDMWLARMIKQSADFSGGTDDAAALDALKSEFSTGSSRVLKFLTVVSDGEGNPGAMKGILDSMEHDEQVFVIVVAMGADPGAVAESYKSAARSAGQANVYVLEGNNVRENIMKLAQYMVGHVKEKAEDMVG